jgi:hypothetical protein
VPGRKRASLLALLLVLAGCSEQSRVDPKATVTVSGTFRDATGQPLDGRPVRLGSGVSNGDGTLAALTLGLACTSGVCRGRVHDTRTGDDGTYRFTLKGRDTQSSFGEAESFLLTSTAAPTGDQVSGAATSARFRIQAAQLDVPTLDLVDPSLRIAPVAGKVAATWSTKRSGPFGLTFETASITPVWRATSTGSRLDLDPRLLEDTTGRVVLSGSSTDRVVGSDVTIMWRSPGVGYASGTGAPDSRGRTCTLDSGGDRCRLTDGDLSSLEPLSARCQAGKAPDGSPCAPPHWATIDLGAAGPMELVVIRGCAGGCTVEVGTDGKTFRPAGSVSDDFGSVALSRTPVRYVRVSLGKQGLRQISVWGPAEGVLRPLDQPATQKLQKPFGPSSGLRDHRAAVAVACVLAGLGLAGVGYAAGRRRRAA